VVNCFRQLRQFQKGGRNVARRGFSIALEARARHGILREALLTRGWNQRQGAEFVGVGQSTFGEWVNLKKVPRRLSEARERKLFELTGKLVEDIWPPDILTEEFIGAPKKAEAIREVPAELLIGGGLFALPPAPEEVATANELEAAIQNALAILKPKERLAIEAHFLEDKNLAETGNELGVKSERARQLVGDALNHLRRRGDITRLLRDYL
jgi:RNA polymerase sigma factor (sigma-70 family)